MNKSDLANKILALEGLSNEDKSALLGLLREHKKYGLVWEDKPEEVEKRLETELPVLREVKDRAIISDNPDAPNHILIEGDNLEALTTLAYTHAGKIDVIYIDPPYNTGNKDFFYNDKYIDGEDCFRHSKWLSFMSKRLHIAKKLLSDRGIIFISIDDNEQAQLKMLCNDNDFFGESNFIAQLIWQKKKGGGNDSRHVATEHEYVFMYAKNKSILENLFIPYGDEYVTRYKESDEKGRFFWDTFKRKSGKQYYAITCPDGTILEKEENGEPISWLRSQKRFLSDLKEGEARIIKINGKWTVHFKQRQPAGYKPRSIISEHGTTSDGAEDLKTVFNIANAFNNPKPIRLISHILKFIQRDKLTILDFFAGSGTTLHATMQLNAEDGGHRTCILCTNNENGICENVTYERNKRVIKGYTTPKGEHVEGLKDNNLRYYRTEFVGRRRTPANLRQLVQLSTDMLCIKEDLYTELPMFAGFNTHPQVYRFFSKGNKHMLIIYHEGYVAAIAKAIAATDYADKIKVYVFSPSEDPWTGEFADVEDKVELCALPAAILNAYKRVLPKSKDATLCEASVASMSDDDDMPDGLFGI